MGTSAIALDAKMLKFLRSFSIISLIAFIIATALLSWFYRQAVLDDLQVIAESKNVALTQSFANSLWPQFQPFIQSATELETDDLRNHPEIQDLYQAVLTQLDGSSVVKVKVYDLEGLTVFSTEAAQIGDDKSTNAGFLSARNGMVASELTYRDTFSAFEDTIEDRNVFSSYIPIRNSQAGGTIEGVFEIYDDVTPLIQQIDQSQRNITMGTALLLGLLYGVIFVTVRQTSQFITRQSIKQEKTEAALSVSTEEFRLIFELAPIGMTIVTLNGEFVRANQLYCDLIGYSEAELVGKPFDFLTHPDEITSNQALDESFFNKDNPHLEMEKRYLHKNGNSLYVILRVTLVRDAQDMPLHFLAQVLDITARKRIEQALEEAHQQALEASHLKTQLLANVSHDLRTPLNAILGYTEMLNEGMYGPLSEEQEIPVIEVIDSTRQLLNFINNLLSQAQIEAGKVTIRPAAFSPKELLRDVNTIVAGLATLESISLQSKLGDDVPSELIGDIYWIRQILINLVSNAIKFTKEGTITISIDVNYDKHHWTIMVKDTGVGIPLEAQKRIYDPFWQVDGTTTRGHNGSGLGLSIVKQLITLMNGEILVESEVGLGTTFIVSLPLIPVEEPVLQNELL